jgi:oxygen-independent coproporphyrinogen-3 oxidase
MYIRSMREGILPLEKEILTSVQKLNEYIMISLRTLEGINIDTVVSRFAIKKDELLTRSKKYEENGLLLIEDNLIKLTKEGKLLADGIAAGLFF